jgi:hypothetical protein
VITGRTFTLRNAGKLIVEPTRFETWTEYRPASVIATAEIVNALVV